MDERSAAIPAAIDIGDLTRPELAGRLTSIDIEPYRAGQIYQWMYRHGIADFDAMTSLSKAQRATLARHFRITTPGVVRTDESADGTRKFLLALGDGRQVEAVFIPDTPSQTFCVSTQVGCAMGCGFCLTATMGLVRNLTPAEIVGQVRVLADATSLRSSRFNIVLMGMGEPLHNYDHTMSAIRILADPDGLAVHPKRVTLSTVGLVPAIERLAGEPLMPNLAVSLHATTEEIRARLVPASRKYPIAAVLDACRRFPLSKRSRITFEYVLLAGVNDGAADARRLAALLHDIRSKVNLIPLNPAAGIPYERPTDARVDEFGRILAQRGLVVSVRKSRGRDIRAACGQLAVEGRKLSPGQRLGRAMGQKTEDRIQKTE
jgi:23S rRNA (adenine2503-C2)-methyltransferase